MLAKIWKKVGLIILIVACIVNIMFKFVGRVSFKQQIENAKKYLQTSIKK